MAIGIKKEFELTEAQAKKVPFGKKIHYHLTFPKQKNGDIYVVSVATFTGKNKKGLIRSCHAGSRLLGRFVKGDESVLVPTRPRNWKALELAKRPTRLQKKESSNLRKLPSLRCRRSGGCERLDPLDSSSSEQGRCRWEQAACLGSISSRCRLHGGCVEWPAWGIRRSKHC